MRAFPLALAALLLGSAPAHARPLTLDECYGLAIKSDPTLDVLRARIDVAKASRRKAWAAIKPRATATGVFTHNYPEQSLIGPTETFVIVARNQFKLALQATVPLFRGSAYHQIGVARKGVEVASLTRNRSRQTFLLTVARAYYAALGFGEVIESLGAKVAVSESNLRAAKARLELGEVPRSDVLRADLVLTQDRQRLVQQKVSLRAQLRQLAVLIGVETTVAAKRPPVPAAGATAGADAAIAKRADVVASRIAIASAEQAVRSVWWSFLPTLDITFRYSWINEPGFGAEPGAFALMLTATLPLYDGGVRYASLDTAAAKVLEANAKRRALTKSARQQIARLEGDVESAAAALVSSKKAVELATTTVRDMQARYQAGTATQLDVVDVAQRKLDAEISLTRARFTRDVARLALDHALGQFDPLRKRGN